MKTKKDRVTVGSGNVFADLGFPDAEDLQLKAELTCQIGKRIKALGLTQVQAAKRLGLEQPDVSRLVNGRPSGFSAERLLLILNSLEVDVEIVLRPQRKTPRHRSAIRVSELAS